MICYFDTSAIVPLVVGEPSTGDASRLWCDADDVVTCRIAFAEVAAALAQALRMERLSTTAHSAAVAAFGALWLRFVIVEVDQSLVAAAAELSMRHQLRGYDAVHCAAAVTYGHAANDMVAVAGDRSLVSGFRAEGLAVSQLG